MQARLIDVVVDSTVMANPPLNFPWSFCQSKTLPTHAVGSSRLKQNCVHASSLNPPTCTSASNASRIRSSAISRTMETKSPFSPGVDLELKKNPPVVEDRYKWLRKNFNPNSIYWIVLQFRTDFNNFFFFSLSYQKRDYKCRFKWALVVSFFKRWNKLY